MYVKFIFPEDQLLAQAEPLVDGAESGGTGVLPSSKLDILRLADANISDPSSEKISGIFL